jgi:hypothetical protein
VGNREPDKFWLDRLGFAALDLKDPKLELCASVCPGPIDLRPVTSGVLRAELGAESFRGGGNEWAGRIDLSAGLEGSGLLVCGD